MCLGTMNFGGRADAVSSTAIIETALDAGINFIDTANVYGHDPADFTVGRGSSEEIIGKALRGRRAEVVVGTKMYFPMSDRPDALGPSRKNIVAECEASLRRLGTDYIDLYQLHHPSNDVPIDESLAALDSLVSAGKVRHIGTSSFAAWQIVEAMWAADQLGLTPFVSEQPVYNLLDRRVERELIPMAQTYGLAVLPWSPTAGGFFSGKYLEGQAPPRGSRFADFWRGQHEAMTTAAYGLLSAVQDVAADLGTSAFKLALAWTYSRPGVTSTIIGPRTEEQLIDMLDMPTLSPDDPALATLDELAPPGRVIVPQYGYDGMTWVPWGPHKKRWNRNRVEQGIDLP